MDYEEWLIPSIFVHYFFYSVELTWFILALFVWLFIFWMCLAIVFTLAYRDDRGALWQVDVDMMDVLFTSLVKYLQLENAYNIFILNPKNNVKRAKYGYRWVSYCDSVLFFVSVEHYIEYFFFHAVSASKSVGKLYQRGGRELTCIPFSRPSLCPLPASCCVPNSA